MNPRGFGNVGRITIDNVSVDRSSRAPVGPDAMALARTNKIVYGEGNGGDTPLININDHIETLLIRHVVTRVADSRPLLRIGPDAAVQAMDVDLTANDPSLLGHILQLDDGGRVEQLNFSLTWQGKVADESKSPIISQGGNIAHLQWVNVSASSRIKPVRKTPR
jgi:hypothetical protein